MAWGRKGYFLISGVGNGIANGEVHSGLWLGVSVLYNNTCIVKRRCFFWNCPFLWGRSWITAPAVSKSHLLDNLLIATLAYDGGWG